MHRAGFATGGDGGMHRCQQPVCELAFALFKGRDHRGDDFTVGEHIARRHALLARYRVMGTQGLAAAEMHAAAQVVYRRQLPILAVAVAGECFVHGIGWGQALFQPVEHVWAEGRQGDVLGRYRAHAGPQPWAASAHGDT